MNSANIESQVWTSRLDEAFDEAATVIFNEFSGLSLANQYINAFSRLLKPDPLSRVLMMGTDQRDLFIPSLREILINNTRENGHIFDFGGGDGQTFKLVADAIPQGSTIHIVEPNAKYIDRYNLTIKQLSHLLPGTSLTAGFDEMSASADQQQKTLPKKNSICCGMAIHMIYFLPNLVASISEMYDYLCPGGCLYIVFADTNNAYMGHIARAYFSATNKQDDYDHYNRISNERLALFLHEGTHMDSIVAHLAKAFPSTRPRLEISTQPSRLYGHSISDIIALCNIGELASIDDHKKYEVARKVLQHQSALVEFRVENTQGPRQGMFSVSQPQVVAVLRKGSDHDM